MRILFSLYLLIGVGLLFTVACGGDDDVAELNQDLLRLGRFDGWIPTAVESNYAAKLDSVLLTLSNELLMSSDTTREGIRRTVLPEIEATTILDNCEADDVLFLTEEGVFLGLNGVSCPNQTRENHILFDFDLTRFGANADVSRVVFANPETGTNSAYRVDVLSDAELVLSQTRQVGSDTIISILPKYNYDITYSFRAR